MRINPIWVKPSCKFATKMEMKK